MGRQQNRWKGRRNYRKERKNQKNQKNQNGGGNGGGENKRGARSGGVGEDDYVAKVVNQLARLGFLRSIRGVGGGIELLRPPDQIIVGEVIVAFEGGLQLLECVRADGVCIIESFCKLKNVLAEAERIQLDYLRGVSIADVLPTRRQVSSVASDE